MIDQRGCIHQVENYSGFVLSRKMFSLFFFLPFSNPPNPADYCLQPPASHQGGIQTQSIRRSSSCMWHVPVQHPNAFQLSVETPPCLLFNMEPHPASSQTALPLCSLSAPRLHYRWVFIPHVMFHQRPPSCGLRVSKSGGIERATGVRRSRRRAAVVLTLAAALRALYF